MAAPNSTPPPASPYSGQTLFNAVAVDATGGTVTKTSDWVDASDCLAVSATLGWSGGTSTPAAAWTVEVENDDDPQTPVVGPVVLTLATSPTSVSGASGATGFDLPFTGFRRVRVKCVATGGKFTLGGVAFAKKIAR